MEISPISLEETRRVRDLVLRPALPLGDSVYPGDEASDTRHFGAFEAGSLAAIATICRESMSGSNTPHEWRLRGMATLKEYQGLGLGRAVGIACIEYARSRGAQLVWCTARVPVVAFYESLGFAGAGNQFALPEHSNHPYILMTLRM
jgi:GNAT superfamily N-acetyltransferase